MFNNRSYQIYLHFAPFLVIQLWETEPFVNLAFRINNRSKNYIISPISDSHKMIPISPASLYAFLVDEFI
jgi:hypothetical protein